MRHNHYPAKGRFLGFYYGTAPVLSVNPEGCAGDWFLNGETLSVWMWDTVNRVWIDTNRVDTGLQRMLTDKTGNSPADCVPSPEVGIKEAYFYVAENADCDNDEAASPRNITFTHFKNGNVSVSVEVRKTSIIILYWNGDYWETSVVPMNVDLSLYAKDAALQAEITRAKAAEAANAEAIASETVAREAAVSAERSRAEAAEAANAEAIASETVAREAAITALSPQLLKGTLYLSSDSTALYTDEARQQEYRLHDAGGAGIWHVSGSDIRGLLIQGWTQATLYPHNAGYLLHWKWDAAQEKWVWESDPKRYAVTQAEKSAWNSAVSRLDDFLTSADATDTAINKWKELESFLSGITDTETLAGLLYEQETRLSEEIDSLESGKADKAGGAVAGNLAGLDSGGSLTDSGIPGNSVERFTATMPTASADNAGKIYLYAGGADSGGTFYTGNKYICKAYNGSYRWESLNGYIIAPDGITGSGGTSLPEGTVVIPLKTTTIGNATYNAGTPLAVRGGGWYTWGGDTSKAEVVWNLPTASADNESKTFICLNPADTPYPRGVYTSYKDSADGQYKWRKVGLLTQENFTQEYKEALDTLETTIAAALPSISDIELETIDTLGNVSASGTFIVKDGSKRGMLIFENTGNNAQRQTLYLENVLKYRTRDADGWGEWTVLADLSNGLAAVATSGSYNDLKGRPSLAAVATSGSYNDLKNRPSLSSVATSGNYESLSNKPLQGSISFDAADSLCQSYQNGVYIVTDGGLTQGLLSFSTAGNGGLMQYLLQDGTIKSRTGSYTGSSSSWNEWQTLDFGVSDYNELLNKPIQIIENESYLNNLNYNNTSGIYVVKSGYGATMYISATTSSSTYVQIRFGEQGVAYRRGYTTEALGNKEWTNFIRYPWDWDNMTYYSKDLNDFTEEGIYFVKGTNNHTSNLPITNTGETVNVAFTLLVSASKPITFSDSSERSIVGQNLTLANRIGSENKQYLRHAICDKKNGETTYTWSAWREAVTQTMLGNGGICTDADINAAIDNGIYSGVASQSGILSAYSTFTMVVVNNYAATAAASAMGVLAGWRQVTQTFIVQPLCTNGQITEGEIYQRTGMGADTITWGELKPVGKRDGTLTITDASYGTGDTYALDFTADFDTICFKTDTKSKWKVGKIPQGSSGIVLLKKNIIFKNPGWKGPSDSSAIILNGVSYTFSAKISAISEFSINGGSDITLVPTKVSSDVYGNRGVSSGGLSCFELWLEVDHDAKTVAMTLIPKY